MIVSQWTPMARSLDPGGRCSVCGTPMTRQVGGSLCPACLVALALDEGDERGDPALPAGSPAHSYQVVSVLARQPGRTRYLARRQDFHALVALEIVQPSAIPGVTPSELALRFDQLRSLRHPAVARVMEAWLEPSGDCCLVSEYVAGRAITHCSQLDLETVLRIFDAVCEAIGAAHACGVLHGGLDPACVVLVAAGSTVLPRLTGFSVTAPSPRLADDVSGLGAILAAMTASHPIAAAAARIAARAAGTSADRPLGSVGELQAAAAALTLF